VLAVDKKDGTSGNLNGKNKRPHKLPYAWISVDSHRPDPSHPWGGDNDILSPEILQSFSKQKWHKPAQNVKVSDNRKTGSVLIRRSRVARNQLVIFADFIFTLLVFAALGAGLLLHMAKGMFESKGPLKEVRTVLIKPGTGIRAIAAILETEGVINNSQVFIYGVNWEQKAKGLKAGEYEIPAYASMRQIMDILVLGHSIEHPFTVPEGLTVAQVFERLAENEILTGDLPRQLPPEGWLMTDTVKFIRGTSRAEIVKRLRNGQSHLVQEIWSGRDPDLPLKDINEFVTLASIVEKETGIASERPRIAAVFYNRLKKNMRLQSDPTVIYGIFGSKGKPAGRAIYRSDLDRETPFNTYKINGLPPSPIANPGRDSLKAVANPPHTDDLYFVADGAGGHVFSRTLDEHNTNVMKWREFKKKQNFSVSQ